MNGKTIGFDVESQSESGFATPSIPNHPRMIRRRENRDPLTTLESILRKTDPEPELSAWELQPRTAEFRSFARTLRTELGVDGALESILVDRVILCAWRLKGAVAVEELWTTHEATGQHLSVPARVRCQPLNDLRRDTRAAERSLRQAIESLDLRRASSMNRWGKFAGPDRPRSAEMTEASTSGAWNVLPDDSAAPGAAPSVAVPRWQERLVYDFNISETSPVVRGTWVTVAHVVTLVVDGWTWAEILRDHPELSEEDVRICLSFATEGDGLHA